MQDIVMSPGQSATLTANAFTAPSGCAFAGWTTSITGPGTSYADQASFTMGNGDATLYAIWLPATIKFKSNGNTVALTGYAIEPTGEFEIPVGVTLIAAKAFGGCDGLTSVIIPPSVTSIENFAFNSCISLTDVAIPPSVISIGNGAFEYCDSLASVTIPSSVASIGEDAFLSCESLTSVTIPSSVTSIGIGAFRGCGALISITVDAANPSYSSVSGILFAEAGTKLVAAPGAISGSYTIPHGVASIGEKAFESCGALTRITFPSSIASVGAEAFSDCGALTSIVVDDANPVFSSSSGVLFNKERTTLIKVPDGMLSGAYEIPSGVTSIGDGAIVLSDGLTSLTIPSSVTSIGNIAICGCSNLSSISEQAATPPSLGGGNFYGLASGYSIRVPGASLSAYQNADNWSDYSGHMQGY